MRHQKQGRKFHRMAGERKSFLGILSFNLIRNGKIETTEIRAKEIRPSVEKFVTIAKKQTLASRRLLLARLRNKSVVDKLMGDIATRYASRNGGYLRITKLGAVRKRDGALRAIIEFV